MYLMYADESGDRGMQNSPTPYFSLSGIILEDTHWLRILNEMRDFRRSLKRDFGLPIKVELHASKLLRHQGKARNFLKTHRECIAVYQRCFDFLNSLKIYGLSVLVVIVFKNSGYDVFETTWKFLLQRFHNFLEERNSKGLLVTDVTDERRLRKLVRKLRRYNLVPSRYGGTIDDPMITIVEDPILRESDESYFVQFADLVVYSFAKMLYPNAFMQKHGLGGEFFRLRDVLYARASSQNQFGIVFYPQDSETEAFIRQKIKPFSSKGF